MALLHPNGSMALFYPTSRLLGEAGAQQGMAGAVLERPFFKVLAVGGGTEADDRVWLSSLGAEGRGVTPAGELGGCQWRGRQGARR